MALTTDDLANDRTIIVRRGKKDTTLHVDGKQLMRKVAAETPLGIEPAGIRTIVTSVSHDGIANSIGIKENDTIIAVNDAHIHTHSDLVSNLQANKFNDITLTIKNRSGTKVKELTLNETGTIGVGIETIFTGDIITTHFNLFEAIASGTEKAFSMLKTIVLSIVQMIQGKIEFKSAVGGPVLIATQAAKFAEYGVYSFLSFTAMLSLSLALINILPFPALDGGHLIIVIIESIFRREIPVKVKLRIQYFGLITLILFMLYVVYNDILRIF